ncbi:3-oxoacid CoA-transferase subunit A [Falsiroseomonas sp.]|uniref:3-oxoacid CoA-transferase subunit A n=1 Tax=Falsiroseomonas sp. TaxID=2870721 RepID=UPI0034A11DF5
MIDKIVQSIADALSGVRDGATVLMGGFGAVGQPDELIEGLIEQGAKELTVVSNNAGAGKVGLAKLLAAGRVRKIICSFPRVAGSTVFEDLYRAGKLELEIVPQGTLAERMRAAGAGIPAFYTPTAAGTKLAQGKDVRDFDGRPHVMELALKGDVALVEAWEGDRWGNLTYRESGRNFNPVMAMAAALTVAQVHHIRQLGEIAPDSIHTPGIFVNRVVRVNRGAPWI